MCPFRGIGGGTGHKALGACSLFRRAHRRGGGQGKTVSRRPRAHDETGTGSRCSSDLCPLRQHASAVGCRVDGPDPCPVGVRGSQRSRSSVSVSVWRPGGTTDSFGTLGDIAVLASEYPFVRPIVDWAHVHAMTGGALTSKEAFASVLNFIEEAFPGWMVAPLADPVHRQPVQPARRGEAHSVWDRFAQGRPAGPGRDRSPDPDGGHLGGA